jgi:hypothetical protein
VRNFGGLRVVDEKAQGKERDMDVKSEPASSSDAERFFSSQADTDWGSDVAAPKRGSRIKTWAVKEGQKWPMPSLLDTLALNYVGCLAMRLPVRIGEFFRWARSERILFIGAVSYLMYSMLPRVDTFIDKLQITEIPSNMLERLPAQYQQALRGRYSALTGGELHVAVTDLILSYRKNYDMIFPPLNIPPLFLRYLRELALPCK